MERLLIILMLAAGCGFAQTPSQSTSGQKKASAARPAPASSARWPIESISVEGNHMFTREQVLAIAGVKVGQAAGKTEFDAARDRLASCGAFETVAYKFTPGVKGQGYVATIQVTEVQQVYAVDFEDLHVSSLDLKAALTAKDPLFASGKLPATQPVLERYTKWVQEYLAAKGIQEKIAGSVRPAATAGDYAIVFHPARNLPAVAQITFEGNQVVPQNVLREAVTGAGIGAPYTEDSFRQILNMSIRPIYEARGRVRVSFPEIRTEPVKDVEGLHVFVKVNEGDSYELGKVAFDGPTPLAADALLKTGDFKAGDVANFDRVSEGLERIRKAVRHAGYLDAKVTSDRVVNEGKKTVDVAVRVDAGPQYAMGKLTIEGLDLNGEAEMKRIWTLKVGKPFNPEYPDLFLKRVRDERMFDGLGETKAATQVNDRNHTVDVTLTFKAADPQKRPGRRGGRGQSGADQER
jgi:outer membrane protein insertion porin family